MNYEKAIWDYLQDHQDEFADLVMQLLIQVPELKEAEPSTLTFLFLSKVLGDCTTPESVHSTYEYRKHHSYIKSLSLILWTELHDGAADYSSTELLWLERILEVLAKQWPDINEHRDTRLFIPADMANPNIQIAYSNN